MPSPTSANATASALASAPSLFVFPETGQKVRTVTLEGNPWFVAADVCRCLGWEINSKHGGTAQHLTALGADEKRTARRAEGDFLPLFAGTKAPAIVCISESGLFKLVLRAHPDRHPAVRKFQDWVTRDVLPAIRKDGVYMRGEEMLKPGVVETLDMDDLGALSERIETLLKRKAELLEARLREAEAKVVEQAETITEHLRFVTLDEWRALPG